MHSWKFSTKSHSIHWSQLRHTNRMFQETSLQVSQRSKKSIQDLGHTYTTNWCRIRWRPSASKCVRDTRWTHLATEMCDSIIRSNLTRRVNYHPTSITEWFQSKIKRWWRSDLHSRRRLNCIGRCKTWSQMLSSNLTLKDLALLSLKRAAMASSTHSKNRSTTQWTHWPLMVGKSRTAFKLPAPHSDSLTRTKLHTNRQQQRELDKIKATQCYCKIISASQGLMQLRQDSTTPKRTW